MNQSKEHIEAKNTIENLRNKTSNNEKFGTYLRFLNPNSFAIGGVHGQELDLDKIMGDIKKNDS